MEYDYDVQFNIDSESLCIQRPRQFTFFNTAGTKLLNANRAELKRRRNYANNSPPHIEGCDVFDPVEFLPTEVLEKILGYLSLDDLLTASTVSWTWHNLTSSSLQCMRKMSITISDTHQTRRRKTKQKVDQVYFVQDRRTIGNWVFNGIEPKPLCICPKGSIPSIIGSHPSERTELQIYSIDEKFSMLTESKRKYENVIVQDFKVEANEKGFDVDFQAFIKSKKWKQVTLSRVKFGYLSQLYAFYDIIKESVEILILEDLEVNRNDVCEEQKLEFKKLKVLKATNLRKSSDPINFFAVFEGLETLKEFSVSGRTQEIKPLTSLLKILDKNHLLESLSMSPEISDQIMVHNEVRSFKFVLKKLNFGNTFHHESNLHRKIEKNVIFMLNKHKDSLVYLGLADWVGSEPFLELFKMTKLESLNLNIFNIDDDLHILEGFSGNKRIESVRRVEVKSKPEFGLLVIILLSFINTYMHRELECMYEEHMVLNYPKP